MQNSVVLKQLKGSSLEEKPIFYKGNLTLLDTTLVSIVGSRRPNSYAKNLTATLAKKLAAAGVCVVSGGAMGVDAIAHKSAGVSNTIMVSATGLDIHYPSINKKLIEQIEQNGLVLSQFPPKTPSLRYHFPLRNELIVALGDLLVVPYADENSGSMRSVEYARKMGKKVFVLPHRIGESVATNNLLEQGLAEPIYSVDNFIERFGVLKKVQNDELLEYLQTPKEYNEVLARFSSTVFEYELLGKIEVKNGMVYSL